ncbi:hypothetical protein [Streptomyces sp. NPDC046942]|uniref:hypothetical protein n=1 Tax=Streptomyces sp. NPDC046942 TaxID=3155137 RepID=UPI003406A306
MADDHCIVQVFDHAGRALFILGLGVYPNLGMTDAYATLRNGDTLHSVRAAGRAARLRPARAAVAERARRTRPDLG